MFKNRWLGAFFVLLAGCSEKPPAPVVVPLVVAQKVVAGDAGLHASFAGEVRARSESALGFRVGGKIASRLVDIGQEVKAGQVLAVLDAQPHLFGRFRSPLVEVCGGMGVTLSKLAAWRTQFGLD